MGAPYPVVPTKKPPTLYQKTPKMHQKTLYMYLKPACLYQKTSVLMLPEGGCALCRLHTGASPPLGPRELVPAAPEKLVPTP